MCSFKKGTKKYKKEIKNKVKMVQKVQKGTMCEEENIHGKKYHRGKISPGKNFVTYRKFRHFSPTKFSPIKYGSTRVCFHGDVSKINQCRPRSIQVYPGLPGSTRVYPGLPRPTQVYPGLPRSTRVYPGLPRSTQVNPC